MTIDHFKEAFLKSNSIDKLINSIDKHPTIYLSGDAGSYISFLAYGTIQHLNGNHLFILQDKEQALYFFNDLENIFQKERGTTLLFYPASYRRPYQIIDPDPSSVLQRTEVIDALSRQRKKLIVVTYPEAIIEKVIEKRKFDEGNISLSVGEDLELDLLNELLIEMDFEKVDHVYEPGQFSVRGGIIDVFSYSNELPYRIELFGDQIDSLREFNPADQLSIVTQQKIKIIPNINFSTNRVSFLEHLPKSTVIWGKDLDLANQKMEEGFLTAENVFEKIKDKKGLLLPMEMYLAPIDFSNKLMEYSIIEWNML